VASIELSAGANKAESLRQLANHLSDAKKYRWEEGCAGKAAESWEVFLNELYCKEFPKRLKGLFPKGGGNTLKPEEQQALTSILGFASDLKIPGFRETIEEFRPGIGQGQSK
jgi:hypothetical protein